jgi:hypothetical protein
VGEEHQAEPTEHTIECAVWKCELLGIHNLKVSRHPPPSHFLACHPEHRLRQVDPDDRSVRANPPRGWDEHRATPTGNIEHTVARLNGSQLNQPLAKPREASWPGNIVVTSEAIEGSRDLLLPGRDIVHPSLLSIRACLSRMSLAGVSIVVDMTAHVKAERQRR